MIPIRSNWDTLRAKTYNRYVSSESVKLIWRQLLVLTPMDTMSSVQLKSDPPITAYSLIYLRASVSTSWSGTAHIVYLL